MGADQKGEPVDVVASSGNVYVCAPRDREVWFGIS